MQGKEKMGKTGRYETRQYMMQDKQKTTQSQERDTEVCIMQLSNALKALRDIGLT